MSEKNKQKKFLHDVATPLGTAVLLTEYLAEKIISPEGLSGDDINQIGQIQSALRKVIQVIQERRTQIDQLEEE